MNCKKCGKTISPGGSFCESCGAKLEFTENSEQSKKPSKLQTASLILGILGFLFPLTSIFAIIFGAITLKEKPNGKAVAGLVLGIVSFIMIPILASMILVALNSARTQAKDARIKSDISQQKMEAEIFFSDKNSYKNYVLSSELNNDIMENNQNQNKPELMVSEDGLSYAIIVTLNDGQKWCVDSSGYIDYAPSINSNPAQCIK